MINLEIDGKTVAVADNSTVMDAAVQLGIYVPHFCYHKKLSIAANCRMCLVQVEKAPKPLPACATPVTEGMKVMTHSEAAVKAQKGVMEFLLINHPLDCPICDQGGECQLQDLAVGYGSSASRYDEPKRVVGHKDLGPLVSAEEMNRCIHCTRCVRFGQEIAGVMELGMGGRGEHSEIMPFVSQTVDSELSGNMIDVCPVGALTSKPFRYAARGWELQRRKSIAPHDGLGSNVMVQIKQDEVVRVLPLENEDINECWLSDRDRFSYEGLSAPERLTAPMIKRNGKWEKTDWQTALEFVAAGLKKVIGAHGAASIGALAAPTSTLEELHLVAKLMRGVGSDNVDFRLRQSDFSADGQRKGIPWLGMPVAEISKLKRILIVGSTLRKEQPLLAQRVRQAAKKGAQVSVVNPIDDDLLMPLAGKCIVAPSQMSAALAQIVKAAAQIKSMAIPAAVAAVAVSEEAKKIAASFCDGDSRAVLLGNLAAHHPQAAQLQSLAQALTEICGGTFGFMAEAANSVGGYVAQALPRQGGLNVRAMISQPRQAYVLLGVEPEFDTFDTRGAVAAMQAAEFVVCLTSFQGKAVDYADALLPIAPFTESAGTFVSGDGRVQSFNAVVKPLGETRPGWKVLRVLGNLLGVTGFDYDSIEDVRKELPTELAAAQLDNRIGGVAAAETMSADLERIGEVPIYAVDALCRHAASLQLTRDALPPLAWMNSALIEKLQFQKDDLVRVEQAGGSVTLRFGCDDRLPHNCVRVAAATVATSALGPLFGAVQLARVPAREKAAA
jgi:NADH-quinone oxidoreductase subunit G